MKVEKYIKQYLRQLSSPYVIHGGQALTAWLKPTNSKHYRSDDWDIMVPRGSYQYANEIADYLHHQTGQEAEIIPHVLKKKAIVTIYRIRLNRKYVVDIHNNPDYNYSHTISIGGIRYARLKYIMDNLIRLSQNRDGKSSKRFNRKEMVEAALRNVKKFNRLVYIQLDFQCQQKGYETLTGYNLNCDLIRAI